MLRYASAAATFGAFALLLVGCGSKSSESGEDEGTQTTIAGVLANDHGSKKVSGETEVELDDYYFEPTVLEGTPGAKVELELKNEGGEEHNFSVESQQIDQDLDAGENAKVTVTIPPSGQIGFFCKYHKDRGMAGALSATG